MMQPFGRFMGVLYLDLGCALRHRSSRGRSMRPCRIGQPALANGHPAERGLDEPRVVFAEHRWPGNCRLSSYRSEPKDKDLVLVSRLRGHANGRPIAVSLDGTNARWRSQQGQVFAKDSYQNISRQTKFAALSRLPLPS